MTTNIEWTDETWNPVTGCTKVSTGCKNCYAEHLWQRLSAPNMPYCGRKFTDIECHPDRLENPLKWKKPRKVFVNSMSDLFHEQVTDWFLLKVFAVMESAQQHVFQILTKRPERMRKFMKLAGPFVRSCGYDTLGSKYHCSSWPPPNVWLGVSVENRETANERIPLLLETPAAVRFLSCEPLLGNIYFNSKFVRIDWVIVGGESGPKARPMVIDWAKDIVRQCESADVPVFVKQLGSNPTNREGERCPNITHKKGADMSEWPSELQVQEYPCLEYRV